MPFIKVTPMECMQLQIEAIAPPGVLVGCRRIEMGDEHALLPEEAAIFARNAAKSRRASGAARLVARDLLGQLGFPISPVLRAPSGAPIWPNGLVGSLAHDAMLAVGAIAREGDLAGVGIDVEDATSLSDDLVDLVATPAECVAIGKDAFLAKLLFVAKEAVYKATCPIDGIFLEHHDIEVDLARGLAIVRGGRRVDLRFIERPRIVAIATIGSAQR